MRYLGRGRCFDDFEEATCISREVYQKFFHNVVTFVKEVLYPKYVKYPTNADQMTQHTKES